MWTGHGRGTEGAAPPPLSGTSTVEKKKVAGANLRSLLKLTDKS